MNQVPYQTGQPYGAPPFALPVDARPQRTAAAKKLNRLCLVTLLQTAVSFVFAIPVVLVCTSLGISLYDDKMAYLLFNAASVPICTALPFVVYLAVQKLRRKEQLQYLCFQPVGFGMGLLLVLAGLMLCLMANFPSILIQEFFSQFGYSAGDSASLMPEITSVPLLLAELFSTAVVVPVMEELAFRGVLLSSLKRFGAGFAIVVSAVVFALVHLDISNVVFALIAGLVFGAIYYYTENLWLSILIHALNNGFAVLGSALPALTGVDEMWMQVVFMDIPVVAGLVAALVLLIYFRKRLTLPGRSFRAELPLTVRDGFAAFVRAPLMWVLIAFMLAYTTTLFF